MTHHKYLRTLCLQTKEEVFATHGTALPCPEGNLRYLDNGSNVLAVCHVDTVPHKPAYREKRGKAFSTALDDRLGIYILTHLLPSKGVVLDWLFTDNEECGASTARYFDSPKAYNWTVEFDRQGDDVVLYQYDDGQLDEAFAEVGVAVGYGSYSDIVDLPETGTTCFNWGIGYQRQHTAACYVDFKEMDAQVDAFCRFHEAHKDERLAFDADAAEALYYGDFGYDLERYDDARPYDDLLDDLWKDYRDPVAYEDPEIGIVRQSETDALEDLLMSAVDTAPRLNARQQMILERYFQW